MKDIVKVVVIVGVVILLVGSILELWLLPMKREAEQIISCGKPGSYRKADGTIGVMQVCLRADGDIVWQRVLND